MELNVNTERFEFVDGTPDLMIRSICPDSADVLEPHLVFDDVVNGSGHTISNGHLGLVLGAEFEDEAVVFGLVEAVFLFNSSRGGLDEDFPQGRISMPGFCSFFLLALS